MKINTLTGWMTTLITAMLVSAPAGAQNALGDGTDLHRSLQIGSGGLNPLVRERDYAARNYLITGNITGLGYFRDEIGYTDPFAFRDETSADDLFRFRARGGSTRPQRTSEMLHSFRPSPYFRPFSASPQQRIEMGMFQNHPGPGDLGTFRTYDYTRSARPLITGIPGRTLQTFSRQTIADGRVLERTASPLFGIQQQLLEPANALGLSDYLPGTEPDAGAGGAPDKGGRTPRPPSRPKPIDGRVWKPSLELGLHIDPLLRSLQTDVPVDTETLPIRDRIDQIESAIFAPVGIEQFAPGDDVYMDLLTRIDRQQRTGEIESVPFVPIETQPRFKLDLPTLDQLAEAETERLDALRRVLGLPSEPIPTDDEATETPETPQTLDNVTDEWLKAVTRQADLAALPKKHGTPDAQALAGINDLSPIDTEDAAALERMIKTLDYELPSLETLAGQQKTRINRLMLEAETHMARGRHFDAAENYQLVLIGVPRHPMARVGVIHAQLGAGMIRSAAVNLRNLFEQHPEMIATRYEEKLLPRPARLPWVRREIEKVFHRTKRAEIVLLLAYLGYQTRQHELVAYGLNLAQTRSPLDPLNILLRRIWIDQKVERIAPAVPPVPPVKEANDQPEVKAPEITK